MLQGGLPHPAGTDLKPVVLPHSPGGMDKRVLTTEIGHHSLQTSRATPRTRPNGLTQQTHVALALRAPDALLYADRTKDTPPCQPFFYAPWPSCPLLSIARSVFFRFGRPSFPCWCGPSGASLRSAIPPLHQHVSLGRRYWS